MIIIGITGTLGAGKGTIVDYLVQKKGFQHFSVRAYLIQKIEKIGMPVNRDSMVAVANNLRATRGPSYIVEQLYEQAKASGRDSIIESIRAVAEIEKLKAQNRGNFYLLAVDADSEIRYERVFLRGGETDKITYDTFIMNEQREMENTDPTKQNIGKCMQMADYVFINNATREELDQQIETVIQKIRI